MCISFPHGAQWFEQFVLLYAFSLKVCFKANSLCSVLCWVLHSLLFVWTQLLMEVSASEGALCVLRSAALHLAPFISCCELVNEEDRETALSSCVSRLFWNPSILPQGGLWCLWASEWASLQRSHHSVEWQMLSGRARLHRELSQFFMSVVRFSFLESCLS